MPRLPLPIRLVIAMCLISVATSTLAGSLEPPPGPVSPTMRSLTEVEPRIPINSLPGNAEARHVISEPGTYYLTEDILVPSGIIAILIGLVEERPGGNDINIDLNGFSIVGATTTNAACQCHSDYAGKLTIMNSTRGTSSIRGWKTALEFDALPEVADEVLVVFLNVDISDCAQDGIFIPRGVDLKVQDVRINECGGNGIRTQGCSPANPTSIELKNLSISSVVGDGVRHSCSSPAGCLIAHEATHISQSGGAGVRIVLPVDGAVVSLRQDKCEMSSNVGSGLQVSCPSSSKFDYLGRNVVCNSNDGVGAEFEGDPDQPIIIGMLWSSFTGNEGGGLWNFSNDETLAVGAGSYLRMTSCDVSNNGSTGVSSVAPLYADNCVVADNALHGILLGTDRPIGSLGSVKGCTIERNGSHGVAVDPSDPSGNDIYFADSGINNNGGHGIHWEGGSLMVSDCRIVGNKSNGIEVTGKLNIERSTVSESGGFGVRQVGGSTVANGLICEFNGRNPGTTGGASFIEQDALYISSSAFSNNAGPGFTMFSPDGTPVRATVSTSSASNNTGNGFALDDCNGVVSGCTAVGNDGWGFFLGKQANGMKVANNTASANGGGIFVDGSSCLVIANTTTASPLGNIVVGAGNAPGPIGGPQIMTSGNPFANIVH